ncbi:MAG: class II aldolase/adducin family protein, partial [Candidatus Hydrogenedentes bacterium]|nr:class II aldolase/adducin family protein [Candidatus Hydrogenedentota bacterium]
THADHFHGPVPVTEPLREAEVGTDYERHIGEAIVRRFEGLDPGEFPAVLCAKHASFTWGDTAAAAVRNAAILEEVARMAFHTVALSADQTPIEPYLLDKHFLRKHGPGAYYGQS